MPNLKFAASLTGFFILLFTFWFLGSIFLVKGEVKEEATFSLGEGQGLVQVALSLEETGLIKSKTAFILLGLFTNKQSGLLAGDYELSPEMSTYNIFKRLTTKGQARKIVIFEGFTINKIGSFLEEEGICSKSDFLREAETISQSQKDEFPFLADLPEDASLEGFLLPDSYEFSRLDNAERVINKMLVNFEEKIWLNEGLDLENSDLTFFEALTMASLLEKEVKTYQDKQIVAGILWKRIRNGWPLQVDATLVYITDLNPVNSHKEIDSPYNTYKNRGLPPGPICNPGFNSFKAALNPQNSAYWYYLSTKDGTTVFSKTLEEHNINRGKYLY